MKKLSNILICIKQDVYTCLFYFLRLSWIYFSHSLRHPSLELIIRLLTLRQKIKSFLLGRCSFFKALHLDILIPPLSCTIPFWDSWSAHLPSSKKLNPPRRKIPVFWGVAPWHINSALSCVNSSSTQHQLTQAPVKSSTISLRKMLVF